MVAPLIAPNGGLAPVGEVRSEHSGDFLRLARLWVRRTHHSWVFAVVNAELYRDELIARLDRLKASAHLTLLPTQTPLDWLHALSKVNAEGAQRLQVTFTAGWLPDAPWWHQANVLRERLADAFPHLVILWLPDASVTEAAHSAPDLWNWRETVCNFSLSARVDVPTLQTPAFSSITGGDKARTLARLADIRAYLAQHGSVSAAAAHLLLEASRAHERLGQLTQSAACAQGAVEAFSAQGNDLFAAQAQGKIADILQARGKLDEALKIREELQLPVYEQLGDIRSAAITRGKIADILQARGKLDEALAMWRDEALPVFERVGYAAEAKIARGRVAELERLMRLPNSKKT